MEKSIKERLDTLLKFFTEKHVEAFETVKVKDTDTLVEYPEFKEGASVSVSTPQGSVPATNGDYSLVNGAEFSVKDGLIDKITKQPDAPVEDTKDEPKPDEEKLADVTEEEKPTEVEAPADEAKEDEAISALSDRVSKIEEAIQTILQAVSEAPSKEEVQDFNSKIEALSKVPTQLSADNRVELKDSEDDKIKRVASLFTKK